MKKILLIALGAILLGTSQASAKFITNPLEGIAMQTTIPFYKVTRKNPLLVPPLNPTHASKIAGVILSSSAPYNGENAFLTTEACRTWWLNEPVVSGETTKWSYYFYSNGVYDSPSFIFALNCSIGS